MHHRLKKNIFRPNQQGTASPNRATRHLRPWQVQFRTLIFHNRPKEQLQEHLRLRKFVTSLPAAIGALDSPLGPHAESDLPTDLYSGSTPITIMDESDRRISFNLLTKSAISLSAAIRALCSLLRPYLESDLPTDLYSVSTLIDVMDEFDHRISFNLLTEFRDLALSGDQGIELSFRTPSRKRSSYRSIRCLYPDSY
jgi:hypothetical protein